MLRSDSEKLVRKVMAKFVDEEVIPVATELDNKGEFPYHLFRKLADMGVLGIRYPKKVGGSGGNTTLYCICVEELARGLMSLAAITAMQCLMATDGLYRYGTKEMHEKYLRPAFRGEKIGAFQLTEPEAGSDLSNVRTLATKVEDGWVINGMKTWSTSGPIGSFHTVLTQTDPDKGLKGLMFFFIPADTPGFSHSKKFDTLGTRTSSLSEIYFNNCHVPDEYMLGELGRGLDVLLTILAEIRIMTACLAIGLLRAAMDDSIRYCKERVQFGKQIGKYQLVQAKIANMAVNLEAGKLMCYKVTHLIDNNVPCLNEASMAKYFTVESACSACDEATRIYGAYAYSMEYAVQRYYRDNRFLLYGGGTHEVLQTTIARQYLR
ncbi:MAG: acyl-CoA dehydrogenase family protein [Deltaproteobacteria bacterium]|nr:acyl-CoA dehydrogenase family protein [Deltaproteobacteria bacterium]MBW1934078.1 acyl-CoA dehydrogenase family protein [Deltaproteobacteria bacterium]MBW1976350.1 acyl-CoA dehydrogenase family protein [Deltaproteobacteria bacterium]MBW2043372.1 acyl-CoA dehydrogenase family protein [Deltaproteobacteria bacterium]MBW2299336.1 acyl-CoA dehydrogenase family protein [Deltaproteobacteria bacterium]